MCSQNFNSKSFHFGKNVLQEYEEKLKAIAEEKEEQESLVVKLTQAAKDKEVEYRIANKKTDNLVRFYTLLC